MELNEDPALFIDVDLFASALLAGNDDAGLGAANVGARGNQRGSEWLVALQKFVVAAIDFAGVGPVAELYPRLCRCAGPARPSTRHCRWVLRQRHKAAGMKADGVPLRVFAAVGGLGRFEPHLGENSGRGPARCSARDIG